MGQTAHVVQNSRVRADFRAYQSRDGRRGPRRQTDTLVDDVRASLERALREDGAPYTLVINKKSGGVDMDGEIARIKKLIGDAKVNVKK